MYNFFHKLAYYVVFYINHPVSGIKKIETLRNIKNINLNQSSVKTPFISIIIVTYNALEYVQICLESLEKTNYSNKEIIVIDNNSNKEVRNYLTQAKKVGLINTLYFSSENTFFTGGNNIGAKKANKKSEYLLLLNSDIEIKNPDWLKILVANTPKRGVISFGKVDIPVIRPDGWCFMVDKQTFDELGGLNEYYKMNWSITEFTGKVLQKGLQVKSISNPNNYVYHFGQKSRPKKNNIKFNNMTFEEIFKIFGNKNIELLKI